MIVFEYEKRKELRLLCIMILNISFFGGLTVQPSIATG